MTFKILSLASKFSYLALHFVEQAIYTGTQKLLRRND